MERQNNVELLAELSYSRYCTYYNNKSWFSLPNWGSLSPREQEWWKSFVKSIKESFKPPLTLSVDEAK